MSNRRLEVFHYRQALHSMQQGLSDRAIARSGLMGRLKAGQLRLLAVEKKWLEPGAVLPDDATLAELFDAPKRAAAGPSSSLEIHRDRIKQWVTDGINGRVVHRVLMESHGYRGSYSSVYRMMCSIKASTPVLTTVLDFAPGDTAQVDFGKGPEIVDQHTGEVQKTWFFVMVLAWSRHMYAELVTDQSIETWLGCHRRAFEHFSGVPAVCSIDYVPRHVMNRIFLVERIQTGTGPHVHRTCSAVIQRQETGQSRHPIR